MRTVRRIQTLYFCILIILDVCVASLWSHTSLSIQFVPYMSFMGLLVFARNDPVDAYIWRCLLLSFIMDLLHFGSFPVYFLSYGFGLIVVKLWYRHIGSSVFEWLVMMVIGLFVKEFVLYLTLSIIHNFNMSLMTFVASRSLWVILGNLILFPVVLQLRSMFNGLIVKRTYRDFT